jgi:signal transduction histidine kinase
VQPDATSHLLDEMKEQTQNAIADIRRLVYGLRPPVLDELGLVAALEDYIAQHDLQGVQVRLTAGGAIPPLPAATELALYRIALEALTNVFRHARATACMVRLTMSSPTLTLEVADDGVGLPASHRAGVGISAMRERAAELGGALEIERVDPHGTRVRAEFPLPAAGSASSPDGEL